MYFLGGGRGSGREKQFFNNFFRPTIPLETPPELEFLDISNFSSTGPVTDLRFEVFTYELEPTQ